MASLGSWSARNGISPRGGVLVSVAAIVLFSIPSFLSSEEIVLHRFSSQRPDPRLEQVLYLAAGVALMQAGFTSTTEGEAADYILTAEYTSETDAVEIRYTLVHAQAPTDTLSEAAVDLPLDESLDAEVGAAVLRLLQTAAVKAPPSPEAKIVGLLPDTLPTIVSGGGDASGVASGNGEASGVITETTTDAPGHKPFTVKFDSSVSAAGVMLFGAIAEYLHYGIGGILSAGAAWPQKSWSLTVGAEASFIRALNDAGVVGGPLSLFTAGPMIQLGSGTSAPYSVAVGVSGGAAVIILAGSAKPMMKTAPYATVGLQAAFPIGGKVSLGAAARFLALFADDVLIMAAVPSVMLRMQL